MTQGSSVKKKDRRLLVLLFLGGAIIAIGCFTPVHKLQHSSYTLSAPGDEKPLMVNRIADGQQPEDPGAAIRLSPELSCAETPAELAMFFALPMPVNRATRADLTRLPGIGPQLADNIVAFRREHGSIHGPEDLVMIAGIGNTMKKKLLPMVCFD